MNVLQYLFYWNLKTPEHNQWRPQPGFNPTRYIDNLPAVLKRTDIEATVVDIAPFVAGAGGLAHVSQLHSFGFTASASVFRNVKTMTAMHRAVLLFAPMVLASQALSIDYRYLIPRWASSTELTRDEAEVRQHIDAGMGIGGISWLIRMAFKLGSRYWAPLDIVMGGALADLMHREYVKAHGQGPSAP